MYKTAKTAQCDRQLPYNLAAHEMSSQHPKHQPFLWNNGIWSDSSESPDPFDSNSSDSDEIPVSAKKVKEQSEKLKPSLRDDKVHKEHDKKEEPPREEVIWVTDNPSHPELEEKWDEMERRSRELIEKVLREHGHKTEFSPVESDVEVSEEEEEEEKEEEEEEEEKDEAEPAWKTGTSNQI